MPIDENTDVGDLVGRRLFVTGECHAVIPVDYFRKFVVVDATCRKLLRLFPSWSYLRFLRFSRKLVEWDDGAGLLQNQIITPSVAKGGIRGITSEKTLFICINGGSIGIDKSVAE